VDELFSHPKIEEHFAGRATDALGVDGVLAELYAIGETGIDVHEDDGELVYTCSLVLRTAEASVVVTGESVLGAALGCLLESLLLLHDQAERGIADIDAWRDAL
jgi:hypothetical protein